MHDVNESSISETGMVLVDMSLTVIAYDRGATSIFTDPEQTGSAVAASPRLPEELLDLVRNGTITDAEPTRRLFRVRETNYTCHAFRVDSLHVAVTRPIIALHIERQLAARTTMDDVANEYHLTGREQQVLIGLSSMGLTNKELAERMNISPNTVKLFVRLMMIKMGVTTRVELVAKILHSQSAFGEPPALDKAI